MMTKLAAAAITMLLALTMVAHAAEMSKEEIAKLPQDKVLAIRAHCEQYWGNNFNMRVYCEDQQFNALRVLLDRYK